ncbi:outer membrane transport energization protein ExbB [Tamilnaduibacter salinus]|uniref:Outer membrane transport energization protein ExbB n=1 Tax=Tamilnaduibacter salinus TaxID=1484056 RepID=A0A2U1CXX8_9GAMM|nr:MotA/TolQ/ExbB proton channel family protein [Tamilnaduibacter salinus]PVY77365.1 outer membrane transport energization protein ExbB [Tamilnaduibacter salinus]
MLVALIEASEQILQFLERGGDVLLVILGVIFFMWLLILERLMYFTIGHRRVADGVLASWEARGERQSWVAHQVRQDLVSEAAMGLRQSLGLIKSLVAICPLLGLLGTVTGMIEVFDVMAVMGTGSARAMASGISKATIPTMAGMVGALTGVFAITVLQRSARLKTVRLEDQLTFDH